MERAQTIRLRVSDAEKALIAEAAGAAGLGISEWLRTRGMKVDPAPRPPPPRGSKESFEAEVKRLQRTMPATSARKLAARGRSREEIHGS
jgi:hypothetical protein